MQKIMIILLIISSILVIWSGTVRPLKIEKAMAGIIIKGNITVVPYPGDSTDYQGIEIK